MINVITMIAAALLLSASASDQNERQRIELDLYNRDQALVREIRHVDLQKGENIVDFQHIADGIYGHTARIMPLEDADELNTITFGFHYDLVSHEKIMYRYVGQQFSFYSAERFYEGKLLSFDDQHLFMQPDDEEGLVQVVPRAEMAEMMYPDIPEGLFTEPTLRWRVNSDKKLKKLPVEISYLTADIKWMCDYRAELIDENRIELSGVFSVQNWLPIPFPDAKVSLVAGQTHRSQDPDGGDAWTSGPGSGGSGETGNRFFEYYRYNIDQPLDLLSVQTVQIPFFDRDTVGFKKSYHLPHSLEDSQIMVRLSFENNESSGAGKSLPEGNVGLYRRTQEGGLSFIGEDFMEATPVGAKVELDVGTAFDLRAKRTRLAQVRPERNRHEETWQVEITSGREDAVTVNVEQRVFGYYKISSAEVDGVPIEFTRESANVLQFPVGVKPGTKATLNFTIQYGY